MVERIPFEPATPYRRYIHEITSGIKRYHIDYKTKGHAVTKASLCDCGWYAVVNERTTGHFIQKNRQWLRARVWAFKDKRNELTFHTRRMYNYFNVSLN